jgi:hypothetical protein
MDSSAPITPRANRTVPCIDLTRIFLLRSASMECQSYCPSPVAHPFTPEVLLQRRRSHTPPSDGSHQRVGGDPYLVCVRGAPRDDGGLDAFGSVPGILGAQLVGDIKSIASAVEGGCPLRRQSK